MITKLWQILGVTDGTFDCDFVVGRDETYILEMSPRLGGNSIAALIRASTGFDMVEYSIRQACGDHTVLPATMPLSPAAIIIFGTDASGKLTFNEKDLDLLKRQPWVKWISMDFEAGTPVKAFTNGRHRVGEALVCAEDRHRLDGYVTEIRKRLSVTVN